MEESTSPPPNVLIVDDNTDNLRLLYGLLQNKNYSVRPAKRGRIAIESAKAFPPDIILLDINMPEMDGFEVCRKLKKIPSLENVPVLFLSALTEIDDKVQALKSGGVDYITKPFSIDEVEARIETHLKLRNLQKQTEERYEKLCKLESLRDQLVHMIVHDLRNPIGVILGALGFVREQGGNGILSKDSMEMLELADNQTKEVNRMVNDLLDVSRLENNKMPLDLQPCNIFELIEFACQHVALAGCEVNFDKPKRALQIECDGNLIKRVMGNLLGNAVKFTPDNGRIIISVTDNPDRHVRVEVTDTGAGIPPEYQQKIFEKFTQVEEDAKKAKVPSSGLGLTFCRHAIEAHGGDIGIESTVGKGSTFWFTLPKEPSTTPAVTV